MKLNNLVFSLLLISSSLSVNADEIIDNDNEIELVADSSDSELEIMPDTCDTEEDFDAKSSMLENITDKASMLILMSVVPAVLDLKEFSKKHSTVIALLSAAATYKLVKNNLK
ncbi:MAG: hypothetical protein P4L22_03250 [Candidatus Babeliales bacterium]|nr:hypothetical protein [Candidatus Babeliales bacterium]